MKIIILLLLFAAVLFAQPSPTTLTLTGPATVRPGNIINLTLSATGVTDTGAVGFQWIVGLPSGYTATATAGAAATLASKTLYCTSDQTFCLLVGMNANVIGNGVIASYAINVPVSAIPGAASFPLSGVVAANAAGSAEPTALGTSYAVMVLAKQDLNGDGKVDITDLQLIINQVIASQSQPAACKDDMNGDGKCDLLDVVNVLLKALGQ